MRLSPKKQQGMTLISMTFIAIIAGSIFLLGVIIVPIYMDHGKVTGALSSIKTSIEAGGGDNKGPEQISQNFFKILNINNLDNLITQENITIGVEETGRTKVRVQYQVTKKIIDNISILVTFDDSVEIN